MKIEAGNYKLELTRRELISLESALTELEILRKKYPKELNGYGVMTASIVSGLHSEINQIIQDD